MKYIKSILLLSAAILAFSCEKNNKPENPGNNGNGGNEGGNPNVEAQAPVVVSASLKGADGAATVSADEATVYFNASVTVEGSTLNDYVLEIMDGDGNVIGSAQGALEGTSDDIENTVELSLNPADVTAAFYPIVILKVTNTDEMYVDKTLTDAENVQILAPVEYEKLYLITNSTPVEMAKTAVKGKYRTVAGADLSTLGATFTVATAVEGNAPAAGAKTWTNLSVTASDHAIKWIAFDTYKAEVSKMIDVSATIDFSTMADYNGYKVFWALNFVQDCEVVFENAPKNLCLQGDRFADAEGNKARYTGRSYPIDGYNGENSVDASLEGYLYDDRWFVLKEQWTATETVWLTGENCSLPMAPYTAGRPISWFGNEPDGSLGFTSVTLMLEDEDVWRGLIYLKENFAFKLYTAAQWTKEITPTSSATPDLLTVTAYVQQENGSLDGNYSVAGPNFPGEGLYMVRYNSSNDKISLEKYTGEEPVINASAN